MFRWLRKSVCSHKFRSKDIELTGIPYIEKPKSRDYEPWEQYFRDLYYCDGYVKRAVSSRPDFNRQSSTSHMNADEIVFSLQY